MAVTYGFFNDVNGDRLYTAEQIGKYLQGIVSSGVYADASDSLQVMAAGGLVVTVRPGRAMLHYHWLENDEPLGLQLAAGGALPRVDAVVMRLDMGARRCEIAVKQGAPSTAPVSPGLERTDATKEYMLAAVNVPALASAITQANITDTRANTALCGWVSGVIDQVDTSTLFLQWQAAYEEAYAELGDYLAAQKAAWDTFFASVTEDNDLPAPALSDAHKVVQVNRYGDGYQLADMPTYAENLLDNSYFKRPVNQRGQSEYTTEYADRAAIDRWRGFGYTKVTVTAGGITIADTKSGQQGGIFQYLPAGTVTTGKEYTMAVKMADGSVYSGTVTAAETDDAETVTTTATGGLALRYNATKALYYFCIYVHSATVQGIEWAALYEGEYTAGALPAYHVKGYAAELLECQRYYYRIVGYYKHAAIGMCTSATKACIPVRLPVSMRTAPTVTIADAAKVQVKCGATNPQTPTAVVWNALQNGMNDVIQYEATVAGATAGSVASLYLHDGGIVEFNAEL